MQHHGLCNQPTSMWQLNLNEDFPHSPWSFHAYAKEAPTIVLEAQWIEWGPKRVRWIALDRNWVSHHMWVGFPAEKGEAGPRYEDTLAASSFEWTIVNLRLDRRRGRTKTPKLPNDVCRFTR